jgi:hypothetical protein
MRVYSKDYEDEQEGKAMFTQMNRLVAAYHNATGAKPDTIILSEKEWSILRSYLWRFPNYLTDQADDIIHGMTVEVE